LIPPELKVPDEIVPITSKSKAQSKRLKDLILETLKTIDHDDIERLLKVANKKPITVKTALAFLKA
jgi:hypothetical protein